MWPLLSSKCGGARERYIYSNIEIHNIVDNNKSQTITTTIDFQNNNNDFDLYLDILLVHCVCQCVVATFEFVRWKNINSNLLELSHNYGNLLNATWCILRYIEKVLQI